MTNTQRALPLDDEDAHSSLTHTLKFTQREKEILACILKGKSSKRIAAVLNLSPRTVDTHIRNMIAKTGGSCREDLIDYVDRFSQREHITTCFPDTQQPSAENPFPRPSGNFSFLRRLRHKPPLSQTPKFWGITFLIFFLLVGLLAVGWVVSANWFSHGILPSQVYAYFMRPLPSKAVLLERHNLVKKIDYSFHQQRGIQILALIGPGGAGKTTLARQYAQARPASIVWEINGETEANFHESFEHLADALASTPQDQQKLHAWKNLPSTAERHNKVLSFVRSRLKEHPDWLLVYDNVEDFDAVQNYFPDFPLHWGEGRVILTTRDQHIQNHSRIPDAILLGELPFKERLRLFTAILNQKESKISFSKKEIHNFLEKIPPYPLDISLAAYYLRETNTSCDEYLHYLSQHQPDFSLFQQMILKEVGEYTKTRFGIVTLAIHTIIKTHPAFTQLLLLMSLLGSQDITKECLTRMHNDFITDQFIYYLNKYSLIKNNSTSPLLGAVFSMHRTTQEMTLGVVAQAIKLQKGDSRLYEVTNILADYLAEIVHREDLPKIKNMVQHAYAYLSHSFLLTEDMKGVILGELGCAHYYLGNFTRAMELFKQAFEKIESSPSQNPHRTAHFLHYLANVHREIGNHDEARELFEKALILNKKYFPEDHLETTRMLCHFGDVFREKGDYEKAKDLYDQSLKIYQQEFHKNYAEIAHILVNLGHLHQAAGQYLKAISYLDQALGIYKKYFPKDHVETARATCHLATVYRELGEFQKAKQLFQEGYHVYCEQLSSNHRRGAHVAAQFGYLLCHMGELSEAEKLLRHSLEVYYKIFPNNHYKVAQAKGYMGVLYKKSGDLERAQSLLEEGLKVFEQHYGKDHLETARLLRELGEIYLLKNKLSLAEPLLQKALSISQNFQHPETFLTLTLLSDLAVKKSEKELALAYLQEALQVVRASFPEDSPFAQSVQEKAQQLKVSSPTVPGKS